MNGELMLRLDATRPLSAASVEEMDDLCDRARGPSGVRPGHSRGHGCPACRAGPKELTVGLADQMGTGGAPVRTARPGHGRRCVGRLRRNGPGRPPCRRRPHRRSWDPAAALLGRRRHLARDDASTGSLSRPVRPASGGPCCSAPRSRPTARSPSTWSTRCPRTQRRRWPNWPRRPVPWTARSWRFAGS